MDNQLAAATPYLYEQTVRALDCIPFYIHHVVSALLKNPVIAGQPIGFSQIEAVISHGIHSPNNPWDLQHYEERTLAYYGKQQAECLAVLDLVACSTESLPTAEVIKRAKAAFPLVEQQQWIELLRLLERDHYFARDAADGLAFKFTVVKRWWVRHRGLETIQAEAL